LLNPDFRDMLSALSSEDAEFLLVGAYALAAHGLPRATGDMDIWIRRSEENAVRVRRALRRFGAPLTGLTKDDLKTPNLVLQIGVAPRRIDILTSIDAVQFDEAWSDRQVIEVEGLTIGVLGRSHLIQSKRAAGRPQDLADVAWLERNQP
jgi:hypothetical protein